MAKEDVLVTTQEPHWQTEWDTEYIQDEEKEKFSLKTCDGELVGLVAYEIRAKYVVVRIVYMESHPESNPTLVSHKKYDGNKNARKYWVFQPKCRYSVGINRDVYTFITSFDCHKRPLFQ